MKTKLYLPVLAAFAILSFSSCKKERADRYNASETSANLDVTLKAGNMYQLNLSAYGNGSASIVKQASAYSVSAINYSGGVYVYSYSSNATPKSGETITDQVTLKVINTRSQSGSGGCYGDRDDDDDDEDYNEVKTVKINFTVN